MNPKSYESFPLWIVFTSNLLAVSVYALGALILSGFNATIIILYLLYCVWIEVRLLRRSCVNCYYYGRVCGTGRGKLCGLLFKKGDPEKFAKDEVTFKDMIPDFLVSLIPVVGGAILFLKEFDWVLAGLTAGILVLSFAGNALLRGRLLCKYCKQREIGCPAEKLFNKEKK